MTKQLEDLMASLPLYPFQVEGVRWLASRRDALQADEMGLGKTLMALAAMPEDAAAMVVCPATVKGTWAAEVARWRRDLTATILTGRKSFRYPEAGEVVILNYELLPDSFPQATFPFKMYLVADEAHYAKNAKSNRTKRLRALGKEVHRRGGSRWALTATPLVNRPPELRSLLQFVGLADAAGIGRWADLVRVFRGRKGQWGGYTWGTPERGFPDRLRGVMLRRRLSDVLPDLPRLRRQTHRVNGISPAAMAVLSSVMADLERAGITLDDILSAEARADQAVDGWSLIFERISEARMALATAKIPAMLEQVVAFEDADEPLVVFSAHRSPIDALATREGWEVITGDVPAERRNYIKDLFQSGELRGLACTIKAGGLGLTLTHAAHALFVDLAWSPSDNDQAERRLLRIGQDRPVMIHRLEVDHPLDRRVNELLAVKARLIDATITAAEISTQDNQ